MNERITTDLTTQQLKAIREGLFEGKSLWAVIKRYWPENPLTILNKLKKRYDCFKVEGVKKGILNDPALIK